MPVHILGLFRRSRLSGADRPNRFVRNYGIRQSGDTLQFDHRIELTRGDDPTLVFQRGRGGANGGGWMQVEPIVLPMDAFSMAQLPKLTAALQVELGEFDDDIASIDDLVAALAGNRYRALAVELD